MFGFSAPDPKKKESQNHLAALQDLKGVGATPQVKRLFKESFEARRDWINQMDMSTSITTIGRQFPHLFVPTLVSLFRECLLEFGCECWLILPTFLSCN